MTQMKHDKISSAYEQVQVGRIIVDFVYKDFELTLETHAITHNDQPGIELTNGFSCSI